ncbi:MAG: hypothetical protein IPN76_04130 [Saprospiraceae bacterium]|nr:hypothetical protein [Saprospiraceae bacterium]
MGDGELRTTAGQLTAPSTSPSTKSKNVLTLGVQWGKVNRTIGNLKGFNPGDLVALNLQDPTASNETTDNVFLQGGGGGGGGNQGNSEKKKDFSDVNIGLLLKSKVNKTTDYNIGVSAGIPRPAPISTSTPAAKTTT